jgi:hypothetical protein
MILTSGIAITMLNAFNKTQLLYKLTTRSRGFKALLPTESATTLVIGIWNTSAPTSPASPCTAGVIGAFFGNPAFKQEMREGILQGSHQSNENTTSIRNGKTKL